jgi:hypothetical protein
MEGMPDFADLFNNFSFADAEGIFSEFFGGLDPITILMGGMGGMFPPGMEVGSSDEEIDEDDLMFMMGAMGDMFPGGSRGGHRGGGRQQSRGKNSRQTAAQLAEEEAMF